VQGLFTYLSLKEKYGNRTSWWKILKYSFNFYRQLKLEPLKDIRILEGGEEKRRRYVEI
jgi:hypothetical protein